MRLAVVLFAVGCNGAAGTAGEPVAWVGEEPVDAAVVRMVAERDGVDEAEARARVADTLRLVAAAREAAAAEVEPAPLVEPARQEHITRAARARVWLRDEFEPEHEPADIPDDDPLLEKAKATARFIHPPLHLLCQLVAVPAGAMPADEMFAKAADPAWQELARARFEPVATRMQRYVQASDPEACSLMQTLMRFEVREGDGVALRVEAQAFHLDACSETAADGSCAKPEFVPEWTEKVRAATPPGFVPPFSTRFGWHLVFVREVLPERRLDDPETIAWIRSEVHPEWERAAFAEALERMRERRAVRAAASAESSPRGGEPPP